MEAIAVTDYRALDAEIQRAVRALAAFRAELARDPEAAEALDALAPFRRVSGKTVFDALAAHSPVSFEIPFRDALRRWVAELTMARIARPHEVTLAKAIAEASAHFTLGKGRKVSYREALYGVVASPLPIEARAYLEAMAERGDDVASAARAVTEVRFEAAQRLGLARPSSLSLAIPRGELVAFANALLTATDGASAHVLGEARLREDRTRTAPDATLAVRVALARNAREGWPARLTARWFLDLFSSGDVASGTLDLTRGLRVAIPKLPEALGASSFARALGAFGYAVAEAGTAPSLPFVLAREPLFVRAHRFALVFASLPTSESFQRRALGLAPSVARDQARAIARASLVDARTIAMRFLLTDDAKLPARDVFEELSSRVFGAPLPSGLTAAWPLARGDEAARLAALATAEPLANELVSRFDDDWFRNPKAAMHLRAIASAPAREEPRAEGDGGGGGVDPLDAAAALRLARRFEEAIA